MLKFSFQLGFQCWEAYNTPRLYCDYCKKLNSLKHLVRTTVAESHN